MPIRDWVFDNNNGLGIGATSDRSLTAHWAEVLNKVGTSICKRDYSLSDEDRQRVVELAVARSLNQMGNSGTAINPQALMSDAVRSEVVAFTKTPDKIIAGDGFFRSRSFDLETYSKNAESHIPPEVVYNLRIFHQRLVIPLMGITESPGYEILESYSSRNNAHLLGSGVRLSLEEVTSIEVESILDSANLPWGFFLKTETGFFLSLPMKNKDDFVTRKFKLQDGEY
jgi:hypothetical protein